MKAMKKILAVLLTLTLVAALIPAVFAENDKVTVTMPETVGHTYEIYQVFTADFNGQELENVEYGSNHKDKPTATDASNLVPKEELDSFIAKLNAATTAATKAAVVYELVSGTPTTAASKAKVEVVPGYYLIKDKNGSLNNKGDDSYTLYLVKVINSDITIEAKADQPILNKQIYHDDTKSWGVVGDNQIGDTVEFRTITTVPDTTYFDTYVYKIHDTMSPGLTSNVKSASDVEIYIGETKDSTKKLSTDYYTVTPNGNSFTIEIYVKTATEMENPVLAKDQMLYSYYTGVLNENAKIYDVGNQDNVACLEYSNNPNDNTTTNRTPDKIVYDWTFKMIVDKIDGNQRTTISGAQFVLSKSGTLKVSDMVNAETGELEDSAKASLIGLKTSDDGYRVAEKAESNTTYIVECGEKTINGLNDGTYYLYEIKAPQGYNPLTDPVKFEISANTAYDTYGATINQDKVTAKQDDQSVSDMTATVANYFGTTLPSTGGIGTTLFYVFGSILVIGAGVLLVSKKRMGAAE